MFPLVLIKSYGQEKCSDIIKNILIINGDTEEESSSTCIDNYNIKTYKLNINTKYFKTHVLLFECCDDINKIPAAVKSKIEASLFYFDSNDRSFLPEIDTLTTFVKDNNIEVASLVTRNLGENQLHELTYDEIKNICKMHLDIVDLNEPIDEPEGYAEVLELFRNHIWSSVKMSNKTSQKIFESDNRSDTEDADIEDKLNNFEELLNSIQKFKDMSQTLSREEVLNNAEELAELFANILNED